jgi:hypothetical protein
MPRNGSGSYTLPESDFVNGTTIDEVAMNSQLSDVESALSASFAVNGEATASGNFKMGSNKLTGLAAGSAATDSATLGQIQAGAYLWGGTAGGTADVITASVSPAITVYAAGQRFIFVAASNNTGAVTINWNSVGAKAITKTGTTALAADDIVAGQIYVVVYDGTQFQLETQPINGLVNADIDAAAAIATTKLGAGALVQVVSNTYSALATGTTTIPYDDTKPQITEGDEYMTVTITPKAATNILHFYGTAMVAHSGSSQGVTMALFQDSTANALSATTWYSHGANTVMTIPFHFSIAAGDTSATTFRIRIGSANAGTLTFNGNSGIRKLGDLAKSTFTIMEVAA